MNVSRRMASGRMASVAISICCLIASPRSSAQDAVPIYETDIRPILAAKCLECHNGDHMKGGLDVSSMEGIYAGGESGEPLVAMAIDESHLWRVIDAREMPPTDQQPLTDSERNLIRLWIINGAPSSAGATSIKPQLTQHDVLPILLLRCAPCHGPRTREGQLALHSIAALREGGKNGPVIVAGDPDASSMISRVDRGECPPGDLLLKYFVKRPAGAEIQTLRNWIAAGAPEYDIPPDVATTAPDPLVSDADRQHWAFQPPRLPLAHGSIDAFIGAQLAEAGLDFSPEAERDTLIRRAHIDLVGVPPNAAEWQKWRSMNGADWYRAMIDHLLASPKYGERWGRYWLDLAGYADSEGGISADPLRLVAWKYRDYVIRAFNQDKPYDRFLIEQLAGDELQDYEQLRSVTDDAVENLIATGFLRMGIDETGSRTMNFVPERLGVINDAITVVSSGIMGLTLECARCHSHKYDPIPQRDYYRLKAIFQGALDEHDWLSFKNRILNVGTDAHRERIAAINPPLEAKQKQLAAKLKQTERELHLDLLQHHYPEQSDQDNQATLKALSVADNNRSLQQRLLAERLQQAQVAADHLQSAKTHQLRREMEDLAHQIQLVRRQMEPPLEIRALWDRGEPSPTYILKRGEYDKAGRLVGPGVPSVLTDGKSPFVIEPPFTQGARKTGRRLAFARWLAQPQHPLTSRVMVNRIWFHHFGSGLVKSLENFGVKGEAPTHPELLDWLAIEFPRRGWSIKEMHRLIMNSRTYRQSSRVTEEHLLHDPQNRLISRMPLRRMDAEALRDSMLSVSGALENTGGGLPDPVIVNQDGLVTVVPTSSGNWRRSIYLQYRRTEIPTFISTFDYPEMGPNCVARNVSIVSPQSLMLMNNGHVHHLADLFAQRVIESVREEVTANTTEAERVDLIVKCVYGLAFTRLPSAAETNVGIQALNEFATAWNNDMSAALRNYCHTIFNTAEFIYVD
jgi:hypothetical protein